MEEKREVKVKGTLLTKRFDLMQKKSDKLKSLVKFWEKDMEHFWGVRGVNLEVYAGETIGLVGVNGSGKSTLANIISGVIPQTSGQLEVNGTTSIIAVNAGLKWDLSGLENIRLKALMHGMTSEEIEEKMSDIIQFSGLGEFIHQPIKNYSAGMQARLGFSIMAHLNPDILIVDEALSVGDAAFSEKAKKKIDEYKAQGKTIFFVSHSNEEVRKMCDRVIWMHYGEMKMFDTTDKVLKSYGYWLYKNAQLSTEEQDEAHEKHKEEQKRFSFSQLKTLVEEKKIIGVDALSEQEIEAGLEEKKVGEKMHVTTFLLSAAIFIATVATFFSFIVGG